MNSGLNNLRPQKIKKKRLCQSQALIITLRLIAIKLVEKYLFLVVGWCVYVNYYNFC